MLDKKYYAESIIQLHLIKLSIKYSIHDMYGSLSFLVIAYAPMTLELLITNFRSSKMKIFQNGTLLNVEKNAYWPEAPSRWPEPIKSVLETIARRNHPWRLLAKYKDSQPWDINGVVRNQTQKYTETCQEKWICRSWRKVAKDSTFKRNEGSSPDSSKGMMVRERELW